MNLEKLKSGFIEIYGESDLTLFFSPSRVNIIGEHLDYNGGHVMPATIKMGTYGVVSKRGGNKLRMASENMDTQVEVDLSNMEYDPRHGWGNYVKGVAKVFMDAGHMVGGMDILVSGDIPNGAGLSSSASLELLIAEMISYLYNNNSIDKVEMAKLCQKAENEFVGVMCGIMDQFIIAVGRENNCIVLDCSSLEYEYVEYKLEDYSLVIMNTNKRRELNDSKYNIRREECQKALEEIRNHKAVENLCDFSIRDFLEYKIHIKDSQIRKRAEHVVYENERVLKAAAALKDGSVDVLGTLLKESHESLKNLYEVTGMELDTIVNSANGFEGCAGARMTGAGFGGCAIALVRNDLIDEFITKVSDDYKNVVGYEGEFYVTGVGDGSMKVLV